MGAARGGRWGHSGGLGFAVRLGDSVPRKQAEGSGLSIGAPYSAQMSWSATSSRWKVLASPRSSKKKAQQNWAF